MSEAGSRLEKAQKGTDSSGFRSTGTSVAAQLHGIGWSLLRTCPQTGSPQLLNAHYNNVPLIPNTHLALHDNCADGEPCSQADHICRTGSETFAWLWSATVVDVKYSSRQGELPLEEVLDPVISPPASCTGETQPSSTLGWTMRTDRACTGCEDSPIPFAMTAAGSTPSAVVRRAAHEFKKTLFSAARHQVTPLPHKHINPFRRQHFDLDRIQKPLRRSATSPNGSSRLDVATTPHRPLWSAGANGQTVAQNLLIIGYIILPKKRRPHW